MEKVFVFHWHFMNGRKFEEENYIKVFATKEGAIERMKECYKEAVDCFQRCYDNEVITATMNDKSYCSFEVYVEDYEDYCEGYILEEEVQP